tara:strand:- start:8838 stop:9269 length:432 start_codon:yes stop_codon:yes gene_type:complete
MEALVIVLGLVVLVALIIIVVLVTRKKRAVRREQVKEIEYLLDRVSEAATKRKTQLYESLESGENAALVALKVLVSTSPVDISAEVEQIETRWGRLSQQLDEFSNQSVQSTLQSSVVTTRAAMTADDIAQLAKAAKTKLAKFK